MKKLFLSSFVALALGMMAITAQAAYESRFDALNYTPAVDGGKYFTLYGSETLDQWQGHLGLSFDYADQPLQFSGTGAFVGRTQSVVDRTITLNGYGALGFTDWFSMGMNVPVVLYNWFFSDTPVAAPSGLADKGADMGDLSLVTKFRLLDIDQGHVGVALLPYITLPTGDVTRYMGSGHVTGGMTLATDFKLGERVSLTTNLGVQLRDDVTRHGVNMDDQFTYGIGMNIKMSPRWQAIIEGFGATVMKDFFSNAATSPLEAGAGFRHLFGDSGLSLDLGANAGVINGVGTPRFRIMSSLQWTSHRVDCIAPPPPDARIQNGKIVTLGKIYFDTNKTTIKVVSYPVLDDVVDVLNKNPQIALLEVQGHTDARASDAYNMTLSQGRAAATVTYLVSKGISASRLRAVGYGESRPIAPNTTTDGMDKNRRTEFVIVSSSESIDAQQLDTPVPAGTVRMETSESVAVNGDVRDAGTVDSVATSAAPEAPSEPTSSADDFPNYSYPPAH